MEKVFDKIKNFAYFLFIMSISAYFLFRKTLDITYQWVLVSIGVFAIMLLLIIKFRYKR